MEAIHVLKVQQNSDNNNNAMIRKYCIRFVMKCSSAIYSVFFPFILLINLRECQSSELNQVRSNASRKGYSLFNMKFALNKFRLMFQIAPYLFLLGLFFLFATFDYTYI